jgi:hypothetical protein
MRWLAGLSFQEPCELVCTVRQYPIRLRLGRMGGFRGDVGCPQYGARYPWLHRGIVDSVVVLWLERLSLPGAGTRLSEPLLARRRLFSQPNRQAQGKKSDRQ